jgi:hypothetical protein
VVPEAFQQVHHERVRRLVLAEPSAQGVLGHEPLALGLDMGDRLPPVAQRLLAAPEGVEAQGPLEQRRGEVLGHARMAAGHDAGLGMAECFRHASGQAQRLGEHRMPGAEDDVAAELAPAAQGKLGQDRTARSDGRG